MIFTIKYPDDDGKNYEMFRYPGGEVQVRLTRECIGILKTTFNFDKIHVVARVTDGEVVALAQLLDAIRSVTSVDVRLILPYLPYARADRRFAEGDTLGLAVFGRMLGVSSYDIVTLDAHSERAKMYIRHLTDVSPRPIIDTVLQVIQRDNPDKYVGVILPDDGAKRYGIVTPWVCEKKRDPVTGKLTGFTVPIKERFPENSAMLIVDDICDGGGTFLGIADQMKDYGVDLYLYVTHGIFSKGLAELNKRFKKIYTTDSFPVSPYMSDNGLVVIPCMGTVLDQMIDRSELYKSGGK